MIYTQKIQYAIRFAIKTHEIYQKQKRKGKDVPYITHPLAVGLILASSGAPEDLIIAGILHDTIEDSIEGKKVTKEMIIERFGGKVYELVLSVTEQNKSLSWEDRKAEAIENIKTFSNNSLLLKSADIVSNVSETINDYKKDGDKIFERFHASKEKIIQNQLKTINTIIDKWKKNPLAEDLLYLAKELLMLGAVKFMIKEPAKIIEYSDYNKDMLIKCSVCGWEGTPESSGWIEYYDDLLDVSCPTCEKMLIIVEYPLVDNNQ